MQESDRFVSKINPGSITMQAIFDIVNRVMENIVCLENIAMSPQGKQVVPSNILQSKRNFVVPDVGYSGMKALAGDGNNGVAVYNSLVALTHLLLKAGTFSYSEYRTCTGYSYDSDQHWSSSGKALFSDSYTIQQLGVSAENAPLSSQPDRNNVLSTRVIRINDIKQLIQNCYNVWNSSRKPHYSNTNTFCHGSCYDDCHDNCNCNCNCDYEDNYICYGPETGYCHGCYHNR